MDAPADRLRFLPGRLLGRAIWALRRRLAGGPRAARRLRGEIAREMQKLAAMDAGLERVAPQAGPAAPGTVWRLVPALFARPLAPPGGTDPAPGAALGPGVALHHDGRAAVIAWRQRPDPAAGAGGQALSLVVYQFGGTFLSLVVEVPEDLAALARPGHRLDVAFHARATRPLVVYLRLNIASDAGRATLHDTVIVLEGARAARFELAPAAEALAMRPRMWLDVIVAEPGMAEIGLARLHLALVRPAGPR